MSFQEKGRDYLKRAIKEIEECFSYESYVPRLLVREGVDPEKAYFERMLLGKTAGKELLADKELLEHRCALIVGNAGSGKTFVLKKLFLSAAECFLAEDSVAFPIWLDLATDLPSDLNLERAFVHRSGGLWKQILSGKCPDGCLLFLDGLDEVVAIKGWRFVNDIEYFLEEHLPYCAGVYIGCRRSIWSPDWFRYSSLAFEVYQTDYLTREQYEAIIPDNEARSEFFRRCQEIGIESLLATPFDGFFLAKRFVQGQPLPKSRIECLEERITAALRVELSPEVIRPPVDRLKVLAQQIACLTTFSGKMSWTEQEVADCLGGCTAFRELSSGLREEIRSLMRLPLFTRTGDSFKFEHQLYQEFLTAQALIPLPLRKQRQLLEAPLPCQRICTPFRGVAAFLAGLSRPFAMHLIEKDPLVAFMAELPPSLPPELVENMLRSVIEMAVSEERAPWREVQPRGERLRDFLKKYRPPDIASFVRPYLESPSEIARLWGVACVSAWGGAPEINDLLLQLAHDVSQHPVIRRDATEAIVASKDLSAIRQLYGLIDDRDDEVRGYVLQAYRQTESPTARDYIAKLRGGSRDKTRLCMLQVEVWEFGSTLEVAQLPEAFEAIRDYFSEIDDLGEDLLKRLFKRAIAVGFDAIPPELIVTVLVKNSVREMTEELTELLQQFEGLFDHVWGLIITRLRCGDKEIDPWDMGEKIGRICTDHILDLLPPSAEGLSDKEVSFYRTTLWTHFQKAPSSERLAVFRARVPAFTEGWRLSETKLEKPARGLLFEQEQLAKAIDAGGANPLAQAECIFKAVAKIEHGRETAEATLQDVEKVLERMPPVIVEKVLDVFRRCITMVTFCREATENGRFSLTDPLYEIPFRVLRKYGESFSTLKLAEIILCYTPLKLFSCEKETYIELLEELRHRDRETWQRSITSLLEEDQPHVARIIQYLIELRDGFFLGRCQEILASGSFTYHQLIPLLDYWKAFKPGGYESVLKECYQHLCKVLGEKEDGWESGCNGDGGSEAVTETATAEDDKDDNSNALLSFGKGNLPHWCQFTPLLLLMEVDDDWAWEEFARRLGKRNVPVSDDHLPYSHLRTLRLPKNPRRLPALADWYALVKKNETGEPDWHELRSLLIRAILDIGGEEAIKELRRLRRDSAYPKVEWEAPFYIMRLEEKLLGEGCGLVEPGELLDFVNRERMGLVNTNRDLFEWVCEAIEEIHGLLVKGDVVAGFWEGDKPKREPECQNVLWPILRLKLEAYDLGTVEVEEFFVGPDRCDFWVFCAKPDGVRFQVAVELKVAREGYGRADLVETVEKQLWDQYMKPAGCRYGVFIVLWFRNDRYPGPKAWDKVGDLRKEIVEKCKEVEKLHGVTIVGYVLDMSSEFRRY